MLTVDVRIPDPKKPPKITFPDRCVNCGKPKTRTWPVKMTTGAQVRGRQVEIGFDAPLCADCVTKENRIGNVTWIPFFLVGVLVCGLVFVPVALVTPEGTNTTTVMFPYVVGAFVGLIAGIIAGTLVEFGLKLLLAPVYGQLLLKRPLTVVSVMNDSQNLVGLYTRFVDNRKILKITFENDDIAREFITMNPQENS